MLNNMILSVYCYVYDSINYYTTTCLLLVRNIPAGVEEPPIIWISVFSSLPSSSQIKGEKKHKNI